MDRVELSPPPEHLHPNRQDGQKGLGEEELLAAISANSQRGHSPPLLLFLLLPSPDIWRIKVAINFFPLETNPISNHSL